MHNPNDYGHEISWRSTDLYSQQLFLCRYPGVHTKPMTQTKRSDVFSRIGMGSVKWLSDSPSTVVYPKKVIAFFELLWFYVAKYRRSGRYKMLYTQMHTHTYKHTCTHAHVHTGSTHALPLWVNIEHAGKKESCIYGSFVFLTWAVLLLYDRIFLMNKCRTIITVTIAIIIVIIILATTTTTAVVATTT